MKMRDISTILLLSVMILSVIPLKGSIEAEAMNGSFGGGSGTLSDPYIIEDVWDLQNINSDLSANYILKNNIDASGTNEWNNGSGFMPIGNETNPFLGNLDGSTYIIDNLSINFDANAPIYGYGLFGYVGQSGVIRNIGLTNVNITGRNWIGGLVGCNYGLIQDTYSQGIVEGGDTTGGLVGSNFGSITNSYSSGQITGGYSIGGLVGGNVGIISSSNSDGNVNGWRSVGGLIGSQWHPGIVKDSYSNSFVEGHRNPGGLVGSNGGYLSNSFYNVDSTLINGGKYLTAGGLFSEQYNHWLLNGYQLDITDYYDELVPTGDYYCISNAQGLEDFLGFADRDDLKFRLTSNIDLSLKNNLYIPYLGVAEFDGANYTISKLKIDLPFASNIGMFGYNVCDSLKNCRISEVEIHGHWNCGCLVGCNRGIISNSSVSGEVNGDENVGGLVGDNLEGSIEYSYSDSEVYGVAITGGLIGMNGGRIICSSSSGRVSSNDWVNAYVAGGLVGHNSGSILYSFSTGEVLTQKCSWVGGLVGTNSLGTISNSYSTAKIFDGSQYVGGLVGEDWKGTISNSYSTGYVNNGYDYIGGLVGGNDDSTVNNCFWNTISSGQKESAGGIGRTTKEMMDRGTFVNANWDFENIWCIIEEVTYPILKWQDTIPPKADAGVDRTINVGSILKFDGSQSSDNIGITNYTWCFNDGRDNITVFGQTPSYKFSLPGRFVVTLNVTDVVEFWDEDKFEVFVEDPVPPIADAGMDITVSIGSSVTFDGSNSTDNVGIINYTWSFHDDNVVIFHGQRPTYKFENAGEFHVSLLVRDIVDNTDSDSMIVTVIDTIKPYANAGPDQIVNEDTLVHFDGSGSFDNLGIFEYSWEFNDGTGVITLFTISPTFTFIKPGFYTITLKVTDGAGLTNTDTMTVTVKDVTPPIADAGYDYTIDEGKKVFFDGSASTDNVGVVNYTWTFNDGMDDIILYGKSPPHLFTIPGEYIITLKVTDQVGLSHTDTTIVKVKDVTSPVSDAGPDQTIPIGTTVLLNGSISFDKGGITSYTWTFTYADLKQTLKGETATFVFEKAGVYTIVLTVVDHVMNYDEDEVVITVIDIGTVKGIVLDEKGSDVEGAMVEISASDGKKYTSTTGSDGAFSIELPHGPFTWKISKEGFESISGSSTAVAMSEIQLDLSDSPLVKHDEGISIILFIIPLIIAILLVVGIITFLILGRSNKGAVSERYEMDVVDDELKKLEGEPLPSDPAIIAPLETDQVPSVQSDEDIIQEHFQQENYVTVDHPFGSTSEENSGFIENGPFVEEVQQ